MIFLRDLFGCFLEFICFTSVAKFYICEPLYPNKLDFVLAPLFSLTAATASLFFTPFTLPIGQICFLIYCLLIRKHENLIDRLLVFSLSYCTIIISQLFILFVFSFLPLDSNSIFVYLTGDILTIVEIFLIFRYTPIKRLYSLIKNARLPFHILFIDSFFIFSTSLLYRKISMHLFFNQLIYVVILISFILIANACILYYDQKLYAEHKTVLSYQQNLPIYESLIQQIRANQHEYTNRIQTLQSLPHTCKDYESICKALKESTESYQNSMQTYPLLQINMPVLASALFNQYTHAEKQNIKITFDIGTAELQSRAPEYQLADYACILTENAIEASKPGYHLYARLTSHNGSVHFEIRNPIEQIIQAEELSKFFHRGYTTKNEKKSDGSDHGLGLYYLHHDIEKYHGTIGVDQLTHENENWIIFYIDV